MKKVIFLCLSIILFVIIILFVLWLSYVPIIACPIQDLQYIKIAYFDDAVECYDSDVYSIEFGCRKYIRNKKSGQVEGSLIISSRELFDEVEKIIMDR